MPLAGPPAEPVLLPPAVVRIAGGRPVRAVWRNDLGGITFDVGAGPDRVFVKWSPATTGEDLSAEAARLHWAGGYSPVPRVLGHGASLEGDGWCLITAALPGENAVAPRWTADPASAVAAIGRGLRALHDVLPVRDCPFAWTAADRVFSARQRAAGLDPALPLPAHGGLTVAQAWQVLGAPPPVDRLVVCHGDACAPNTLLGPDGSWAGHVDLGALGVADRWADLAVATWSTEWNYGPGWEGALLAAYGIGPDPVRTAYYRLLWDFAL